jgi:hypothetical protein
LRLAFYVAEVVGIVLVEVESRNVLRSGDYIVRFPEDRTDGRILGLIGVVVRIPVVDNTLFLIGDIRRVISAGSLTSAVKVEERWSILCVSSNSKYLRHAAVKFSQICKESVSKSIWLRVVP